MARRNVLVIYSVSLDDKVKCRNYHNGFIKACQLLQKKHGHQVTFVNHEMYRYCDSFISSFDCIILYEQLLGEIYKYYEESFTNRTGKFTLTIAVKGTVVTDVASLRRYDVIFYKTQWYYNHAGLSRHPCAIHAFGIDRDIMKPIDCEKKYDYICVGTICPSNRQWMLNKFASKNKLAVGDIRSWDMCKVLNKADVTIMTHRTYDELALLYNQSRTCYVTCQQSRDGESIVLEARACNIDVTIADDNVKLQELLDCPIYDAEYYANKLNIGVNVLSL